MPADSLNVLFLCTGNSARSVLAEALLNHLGSGRVRAYSAGSHPKGAVHPGALAVLAEHGIPADGLRSKSWDEFAGPAAPPMNFIITVCDNAAGEACPIWPGRPTSAHWGIADPAVEGPGQRAAFEEAYGLMRARVEAFVALPLADLDAPALATRLREIGSMPGATPRAQQTA